MLTCNMPYQKVGSTKRKHEPNLKKHTAFKTDIWGQIVVDLISKNDIVIIFVILVNSTYEITL